MQSYSEYRGVLKIDWNKAIDEIATKTYIETGLLLRAASSWVTCACGNQSDIIPRNGGGRPYDSILSHLGGDFYNQWSSAFHEGIKDYPSWQKKTRTILQKIEERSAYLIKQIQDEQITRSGEGSHTDEKG